MSEEKNKKDQVKKVKEIKPKKDNSDLVETYTLDLLGNKRNREIIPDITNSKSPNSNEDGKNSVTKKIIHTPPTEGITPKKYEDKVKTQAIDLNEEEGSSLGEEENDNKEEKLYSEFYREMQKKYNMEKKILSTDYLRTIPEFNPSRRVVLLEWIMGVCANEQLKRETFHNTVTLIDSYISSINHLSLNDFQLAGSTCLLLAAKYEEIYIPPIQKLVNYSGNAFTLNDLKEYEKTVVKALKWKMNFSNILQWSNLLLLKWDLFISNYDSDSTLKFMNEDDNRLYLIYCFIIDTIILDYSYRLIDMKLLCICVLYLLIENQLYSSDNNTSAIENKSEYGFTGNKYYYNFFMSFLKKNKELKAEEFHQYLPYVSQFMEKANLKKIRDELIDSRITRANQDYNRSKIILAISILKKNEINNLQNMEKVDH